MHVNAKDCEIVWVTSITEKILITKFNYGQLCGGDHGTLEFHDLRG